MAEYLYDTFKVHNKISLNTEDYRSLASLYLPLMGIDSHAIYCVLNSLEDNQTYTYKKILNILNFTNLNLINKGIAKLEGLSLIKSYFSESKGYLYEIYPPLSFSLFYENEMLMGLLESQIGETEINKLNNRTKIIGYKDISKKFNDVYETSIKSPLSTLDKLIKPTIIVENSDFNYSLFKLLFNETIISEEALSDEQFRNRIYRISYTYKLNEEEMKDVIIKTIDIDKCLEYANISRNARYAFQNKYKIDNPRIVTKQDDSFIVSIHDDEWREIVEKVENMQIADTLQSVSGIKPSVSEIKVFEDLMNNTNFTLGVINMMILYVNAEKQGELPGYNYFEKIANTWARAKIKTSYDVLKHLEKGKVKKETKSNNNKNIRPVPDWYDKYTKQLHGEEMIQTELSETEKQELSNLAKDIF